ncbi:hypothetical protein SAMN05444412_10612 [Rhodonellum ikkaensis]|uniref:Uncharacterized protein n=1 Tax=Rhodonellum ikkaensis TaxID=336829 RepID=A0A1H3QD89_9BACT|nr:hypothetical protein SAMN05444412_10612 [Rhodonellum ikkaensis]
MLFNPKYSIDFLGVLKLQENQTIGRLISDNIRMKLEKINNILIIR